MSTLLKRFIAFVAAWALIGTPCWQLVQAQCVIPGATTVPVSSGWSPLAVDTGKIYYATCASACTMTLPSTPPTSVWRIGLINIGPGVVTINPNGVNLDTFSASQEFAPGQGTQISTDGANYYTNFRSPMVVISNAGTTGTTLYTLTKLTGAPSSAVIAATTDTSGAFGITVGGAGTTGNAIIQTSGEVPCVFSNATTAGDYVQISSATGGDCLDAGSTKPKFGEIAGKVLTTNGSAGTYVIYFNPEAGSINANDLASLTYNASGTTTFAANSAFVVNATVTATHSTSTTFSPTGLVKWGSYVVEIGQDSTGGGVTFTLGTAGSCSAWKIGGGGAGAITLSTGANAIDVLAFTFDGTNCVANFRANFN